MSSRSMKVSFLYKIIRQKPYLETRVAFKTRLNINLFCTERTEGQGGWQKFSYVSFSSYNWDKSGDDQETNNEIYIM